MDYEQKYKEALERARDLHDNHPLGMPLTWMTCEKIFPELKESEDERIRKELIERFKWELKGAEEQDAAGCSRQKDIAMFKRGIAWLEKQGEIIDEYEDKLDRCACESFDKGYKAALEKQGEKSWSEEDEKNLNSVKWIIENSENLNKVFETIDSPDYIKKYFIDWLKSIKPRWKPTEENIKDLEWCAELFKEKMGIGFHRLQVFIDELKNI